MQDRTTRSGGKAPAGGRPAAAIGPAAASRRLAGALGVAFGLWSTAALAGPAVVGQGGEQLRARLGDHPAVHQVQAQPSPGERAREQAIIGRLEEEIRRLTGRVEQLEFEQRTVNGRIDQLIEDLDQRLSAIEQGAPLAGDQGDAPAGEGQPPGSAQPRVSPEEALRDLATPPGEGTLGSVPESAIAGLPRPDPAAVAAPERSSLTAEQQYENAVQLLQRGDYQGAQNGLELFLDMHKDHQLASNAAYWLAETFYVRENYSAAAATFARNYRTYGQDSSKAVDNLLKLGMSLANLGENDKACLSYDELANSFPNRPAHIDQALSRERARAQCG